MDLVCVGAIAGSFGVKGEVRLKSFCAEPAAIGDYAPLTDEAGRSFDVTITRAIKNGLSARLSGVASKEAADALRGTRLFAPARPFTGAGLTTNITTPICWDLRCWTPAAPSWDR